MDQEKKPGGEWFEAAFGGLYPMVYAHRDDAAALEEVKGLAGVLELSKGGGRLRTLDVCCGAGRHTEALAGLCLEVLGIDLSMVLLEQAVGRPGLAGRLARADIRALPFVMNFDLVTNLFTSFGYFIEEGENEHALAEMVRVLVPGGRLILDHINRAALEKNLVPEDTKQRDGFEIRQRRRIEGDRIIKEIDITGEDGRRIHLLENVRLYRPAQMKTLFERAGLERVRFYGGLGGAHFHPGASRMVAVAKKRGG